MLTHLRTVDKILDCVSWLHTPSLAPSRATFGWLRLFLGAPLSCSTAQTQLYCHQGKFQALSAMLQRAVCPGTATSISILSQLVSQASAVFPRSVEISLPCHSTSLSVKELAAGHYARPDLALYVLLWHVTKVNPCSQGSGQRCAEEPAQALRAAGVAPALSWSE